jgi:hypothetical protein
MRRHTNQPPIDRATRSEERRLIWAGLAAAVIGTLLLLGGLLLPTGVTTRSGAQASEADMVKAFRHGGISLAAATGPAGSGPAVDPNAPQACPT